MKKLLLYIGIGCLLLASCSSREQTDGWTLLFKGKAKESQSYFEKSIQKENNDRKDYLGLAYSQIILDNGDWRSTIEEFSNDPDSIWMFGHLAIALASYYEDSVTRPDFSIEAFKALHMDGSFETILDGKKVKGEYKDFKEVGTWYFYDLEGNLLREEEKN